MQQHFEPIVRPERAFDTLTEEKIKHELISEIGIISSLAIMPVELPAATVKEFNSINSARLQPIGLAQGRDLGSVKDPREVFLGNDPDHTLSSPPVTIRSEFIPDIPPSILLETE